MQTPVTHSKFASLHGAAPEHAGAVPVVVRKCLQGHPGLRPAELLVLRDRSVQRRGLSVGHAMRLERRPMSRPVRGRDVRCGDVVLRRHLPGLPDTRLPPGPQVRHRIEQHRRLRARPVRERGVSRGSILQRGMPYVCDPACPDDKLCFNGGCVADPCSGTQCPIGEICNPNDGMCVDDPSARVENARARARDTLIFSSLTLPCLCPDRRPRADERRLYRHCESSSLTTCRTFAIWSPSCCLSTATMSKRPMMARARSSSFGGSDRTSRSSTSGFPR